MKSFTKASGTASAGSGFSPECVGVLVEFGVFFKKTLKLGDGPNCNFTFITF